MEEEDFHPEHRTLKSLGLDEWIVSACKSLGITRPTKVQGGCIPSLLKGLNVLGSSPTGTGKTAAFALPMLQKLSADVYAVFAIVLTPTRELASQLAEQFAAFGAPLHLRVATLVGKADWLRQGLELSAKPHIIIATPGRLAAHISSGCSDLPLKHLSFLVMDEADRLLMPSGNFGPDLQVILNAIPPPQRRQTLLFSATISESYVQVFFVGNFVHFFLFIFFSERKKNWQH